MKVCRAAQYDLKYSNTRWSIPRGMNAYFMESFNTLGIRESRLLVGDYVLRGREVICCQEFPNTIAHDYWYTNKLIVAKKE